MEQMEFHVRLTQAAEAKHKAGRRDRMLWRISGPRASSILMPETPSATAAISFISRCGLLR